MENKKSQESESAKRNSLAQSGVAPSSVKADSGPPGKFDSTTQKANQLSGKMAPIAGQKGVTEMGKVPSQANTSLDASASITRPFEAKAAQGKSILKKGASAETNKLETSQLIQSSFKIQDDANNTWRKKQDRMKIYNLQKNFSIAQIQQEWIKNLILYKKNDQKGDKKSLYLKQVQSKNDLIMHVTEQTRLEKLQIYEDRWPLLNFRKNLLRMRIQINQVAMIVLKHPLFENSCLAIIGVNCYCLATDDPTAQFQTQSQINFDKAFLGLYSFEMIVKIVALGFLFNKGAYLRDPWNVLDFVIVGSAWLTEIQTLIGGTADNSLGALRAFRVLRPLKAVTSIKGLQVLVVAVLRSIPLLKDTFVILIFFFLIFAIAGLQLFSGLTKQTCIQIEKGSINMDFYQDQANQGLCGGQNYCPSENFCGQVIGSADYGVTNFDNILWGLLQIFVSITLEGWSEFMTKYQKVYTWLVGPLFFIPIAYMGGFFLLNLLLAVINSSFSSSNAILQENLRVEIEKAKKRKKPSKDGDWKDPTNGDPILEIGSREFYVAKRAAKKMIEKLRTYQAQKAYDKAHPIEILDEEDDEIVVDIHLKKEVIEVKDGDHQSPIDDLQANKNPPFVLKTSSSEDILDDDSVESEEHSKQVTDFLKQLERDEKIEREIQQKKKINIVVPKINDKHFGGFDMSIAKLKNDKVPQITKLRATQGKKPQITTTTKINLNDDTNLEDLLDINKLLGNGEGYEINKNELSFNYSDQDDMPNFSDDDTKPRKIQQYRKDHKIKDADSAIQSDSSLEETFNQAKVSKTKPNVNPVRSMIMNEIKRRIKDFKKEKKDPLNETGITTAIAASQTARTDGVKLATDQQQSTKQKFLAEIGDLDQLFNPGQRPKSPYEYIDKKLQCVAINPGMPYLGTSVDEILEIRNELNEANDLQDDNKFLISKYFVEKKTGEQGALLQDESEDDFIKPQNDPYQLKTVYSITQDEEYNPYSDDEEAVQLELEPFDSCTSVGYQDLLSHVPIRFRTRLSDIVVSSTLQITVSPAGGEYSPLNLATLTKEELEKWCDKRHEFRALQVKIANQHDHGGQLKNQPLDAASLLKSISVRKQEVASEFLDAKKAEKIAAIANKKKSIIPATLLQQPLRPEQLKELTEEEKRNYTIQKNKYDGVKQSHKVMEVKPWEVKFTLEDCALLQEGKFHEEQVEDEQIEEEESKKEQTTYLSREEDFYELNLKSFEKQYKQQWEVKPRFVDKQGKKPYVPLDLKNELNFPDNLDGNQINYIEILKKDCNRKRKTPVWSGQEVLETGLNQDLAEWAVKQINGVRVWPKGYFGWVKKFRVLLKMIIKANLFDNMLMAAVLCNTVIMSLASYGITPEFQAKLDSGNEFFTWFFIVEMTMKLTAIGVKKYVADKMNWLDGGIVSLSVMEMVLVAVSGGGGNLSAFKTIRVLRTLRVLRVARLLKGMESMQQIIGVFVRSASSFAYIMMLLFVFLFIYTLLGMQQFGGFLNFPTGLPRHNYDSFLVAFYSSFQIMSGENWNGNVIDYLRAPDVPTIVPPLYLISWIFIGNYVLLNLFLAILLDSFLEEDGDEDVDLDEMARLALIKREKNIEREKIRRLKKLGANYDRKNSLYIRKNGLVLLDGGIVDDVDDLEHKALHEIFVEEGLIKTKDPVKEEANMYSGVHAQKSLYLFPKQFWLRRAAYKMVSHKVFDQIIMLIIAISSAKLALATYEKYLEKDSPYLTLSNDFDICLNAIFLFECVCKNIALGFCMEEGSYLRESWNKLDFFIVCSSLFDMMLANVDIPAIKILRLLRTLRPLRVISHNKSMKLIVGALFESVEAIANVVLVVGACWLMFGIFGMNLFAGKFYYCLIDGSTSYTLLTMYACESVGGNWLPWMENFDNILQAILCLFSESSGESWPDVMYRAMDSTEIDRGPQFEINKINGGFFILFMLVGNFFLMNFFVGVLFLKYEQAARRERAGFTEEQLVWFDIQGMILNATVPHEFQFKPLKSQTWRFNSWRVVTSKEFDFFIIFSVCLNILQMALYHASASLAFLKGLEFSNYIFTAIFLIEAMIKLFCFRLSYFKTAWNKFDFFVCCSSVLDILMTQAAGVGGEAFQAIPQIARIMRVFRVTRILKVAGKNEGLQALLATMTLAIGPIMNVFCLLVLVLFIFAVLGNFLLGDIHPSWVGMSFYSYKNFSNFHLSFQTMFVITTGEGWNYYMYDAWTWGPYCTPGWNCGSILSPIYFLSFVMIVQFVMINLFALVVIEQFEMYYMAEDNPISKFKKSFDVFVDNWQEMTKKYRGIKMREKQLVEFFQKLKLPIGLPEDTDETTIKRIVLKMGIRSNNGYIFFTEILYRCMRRVYGNFKLSKKLQIRELMTQFKVFTLTMKALNTEKKVNDHEYFFKEMIGSGKSVNPFLQMMYYRISFNTWRKYTRQLYLEKKHNDRMQKKKTRLQLQGRTFIPHEFEPEKSTQNFITIDVEIQLMLTSEEEIDADVSQTDKKLDTLSVSQKVLAKDKSKERKDRNRQRKLEDQSSRKGPSQSDIANRILSLVRK